MVSTIPVKKNKVILSDYPYLRDIENRILMSHFSVFEIHVLQEILSASLQIPIHTLVKSLEIKTEDLLPALENLKRTCLFQIQGNVIIVDKEMRKYYDSQIVKFDEEFETGVEFLKGLLRKVPIDVLPTWYALPRTTNDIFHSLIEKHLLTPKIYQRYLIELNFEDPILTGIMQDVFSSAEMRVPSKELREKYSLSREQFEEYMLLLEYNFVCCLRYTQIGDSWNEVVTPFHEWREYLLFLQKSIPNTLPDQNVQSNAPVPFGFLNDLEALIISLQKQTVAIELEEARPSLFQAQSHPAFSIAVQNLPASYQQKRNLRPETLYMQQLIDKLFTHKLAQVEEGKVVLLKAASQWLAQSREDQALQLYRQPTQQFYQYGVPANLCNDKNIREIEKSLQKLGQIGWVKFDEFFKGLLIPIGQTTEVTLKKVGRQWKYVLPQYSDDEKLLVKATIFERLWEMGMVEIGTFESTDSFRMTSLGQKVLCYQ